MGRFRKNKSCARCKSSELVGATPLDRLAVSTQFRSLYSSTNFCAAVLARTTRAVVKSVGSAPRPNIASAGISFPPSRRSSNAGVAVDRLPGRDTGNFTPPPAKRARSHPQYPAAAHVRQHLHGTPEDYMPRNFLAVQATGSARTISKEQLEERTHATEKRASHEHVHAQAAPCAHALPPQSRQLQKGRRDSCLSSGTELKYEEHDV